MLEEIGKKIKEARETIGLSQKDLGIALGLSDKAVSAYEAARTIPPLETLVRIAEELNKPIDYFINPNASDFKVETQLATMESTVARLLQEIQAVRESLKQPAGSHPEDAPATPANDSIGQEENPVIDY